MLATCASSSRRSASATPRSRSSCTARRGRRGTSRTTSCASCTASSTCSRTRRSSSRAYIMREARAYLDTLAPPFFRALVHYAKDGSYSWHCPGHSGGVAFLKSPVGQMFHQFFGENMLRADVCNSVDELGQLLDHSGPVAASERNAARIFNADQLFFVTNGTSTSNKMVWHATVAPGDIVVVDRNCHKSVLHAITMTGAIPVFLTPTRNHLRHHRPDPARGVPLGEHREEDRRASVRARASKNEAAHPDAHAEHVRRRALQRRDDQGAAVDEDRHAALRRGVAAARGVPRFLPRHARDRQGPAALEGRADLRDAIDAQAAGRAVAGVADPRRSTATRASSTATGSTRRT